MPFFSAWLSLVAPRLKALPARVNNEPSVRQPGIVYMLARENWAWNPFAKQFWKGPPHFMLYAPFATQEDLGGFSGPHMPVVLWPGQPDAFIIVMAQDSSRH